MSTYWLITYQQRQYGRMDWQVANCATGKGLAQWLADVTREYPGIHTILLFAVEISEDECRLIRENV